MTDDIRAFIEGEEVFSVPRSNELHTTLPRYVVEHTQDEFGEDVWWVSDLETELGDDAAGENFATPEAAAEWIEHT